jgi:hypothetical protein
MPQHAHYRKDDEGGWILLNVDEVINRLASAAHSRSGRAVIVGVCIAVAAIVVILPSTWRNNGADATPAPVVAAGTGDGGATGVESTTTAVRSTTTAARVHDSVPPVTKPATTTTTTVVQPIFPVPAATTPVATTPPVTAPPVTAPVATTPPATSPPDTGVAVPR